MNERDVLHDDPGEPTEIEKRLLASARVDVPSAGGKQRALAALGLAAATTTAATAGGATSAGAIATSLMKWIVVGALGGVVTSAALDRIAPLNGAGSATAPRSSASVLVRPPEPRARAGSALPEETRPVPAPAPEPQKTGGEPPPPKPVVLTSVSPPRMPTAPVATPAPADPVPTGSAAAGATAPAESSQATLLQEVSSLEAARRELASGQAEECLRRLGEFDRRFPRPSLGQEAAMTRLEALVALGRVGEAQLLGARLLREQPDTAYAQRVRSLLGAAATNR